jgi:hypothetical protein
MFNLIFGKKKSSPIKISVLGTIVVESKQHQMVLIECSRHGKGIYLFTNGEMTEKDIKKTPFIVKMSGSLRKNPVSLHLTGGKPRELTLNEAVQVVESLDNFTPIEAFYSLKKDLEPGAKKAPKAAKPNAPDPSAIEVKAEAVTE